MVVLKLKDQVHMCTLSDLPTDALRLDVTPGNYELRAHGGGYIFLKQGVDINNVKVVKVFNTCDGEYGLSGTYYDGESSDVEQCRLFNDHFWKYVDWKKWNDIFDEDCFDYYEPYDSSDDGYDRFENASDELDEDLKPLEYNVYTRHREAEEGFDENVRHAYLNRWKNSSDESSEDESNEPPRKRTLLRLPRYHNLPFLFYLSKPVQNLRNVDLTLLPSQIMEDFFVWEVKDRGENVGYVVKSLFLHDMMRDEAGIAVYQGATAFGNFNRNENYALDEDVFYPHRDYICEIKPCNCRTIRPNFGYRPNTKQR